MVFCVSCCLCFINQIFVSYLIYCATTVQELNYAEIRFQNKDEGNVQLGLENNSTQYAVIQANRANAAPTPPSYDVHMQRMQGRANGAQT